MDIDLFLLNKLDQLKQGGSVSAGGNISDLIPATDATTTTDIQKPIATYYGTSVRGATPVGSSWASTVNGNAFYTRGAGNQELNFWGPKGQAVFDYQEYSYIKEFEYADHTNSTGIQFADRGTCGIQNMGNSHNHNTSYGPFGARIMFLRNTTTSSINKTVYAWFSSYYSSGYDGTSILSFTPNSSNFTDVTSVQASELYNYTSNTWINTASATVTIPAQTTVAVVLTNTFDTWTGVNNSTWCYGHNGFYNLGSTVQGGIECDMRALEMYAKVSNQTYATGATSGDQQSTIVSFFNSIGDVYGNYNTEEV